MQGDDALLFGETAVTHGFITRDQLQTALDKQRARAEPQPLGAVLVDMGLITAPQATAIDKLKVVKQRHAAEGAKAGGEADARPADEDADLTGLTLGGCLVLERIGTGSMGTAYRAHHMRLDRDVVVKVLHPRLVALPGNLERFGREARAAAALEHPAIVSIYDFDAAQGYHFIVMQHVDGQNLRQVLSTRGALGPRRALWVAARVLEGLSHAHHKGIVHRDVKPANLIITREPRIKIADFGLVRILSLSTSEKISVFGEIIGTPQYMAPEQATCDDIDARTDLYSLGVSLFELIAGRPPFTGASTVEVLEKQIMEPLPRLMDLVPDATEELQRFLERLAAKDPCHRFQTADEALAALQALRTPDRGTTQRLASRGGLAEGGPADPSRNVDSPPIVSEEALDELKRRLMASRQFVAFEEDGSPVALEAAPSSPEAREAAIDATFAGTDVTSTVQRKARARIDKAVAEGKAGKVVPELLLELLEGGHLDEILALERDLDRALPTSAAVAFFLGMAYERKKRREEARAKLALACVLAPDHLPARLHLARVLVTLERTDEAVQTLQEANRWHPTSVQAATRLAEVLFVVKRDPQGAIGAYERAIELAPNRWQLRQQLALALEQLGRLAEAEAVLEEVVAWKKDAAPAKELLEQVRRKRRKQEALAGASSPQEATEKTNAGPETSARLSAIRLASAAGRWEKALAVAARGLEERPRSLPLLLAQARAQVELGRLSEAVSSYGLALTVDPANEEAQQGLVETQERRRRERAR